MSGSPSSQRIVPARAALYERGPRKTARICTATYRLDRLVARPMLSDRECMS